MNAVLVPLDGSLQAETALPVAIDIAHHTGATLHLFSAIKPAFYYTAEAIGTIEDVYESERDKVEVYLDTLQRTIQGCRVECVTLEGDPVTQIIHYADEIDAALIVMGSHGRSGITRLLMGSVASGVVHNSPIPVLVTRRAVTIPNHNQMLVPLDGSLEAESILPDAIQLARLLSLQLVVLRVVPKPGLILQPQHGNEAERHAAQYLEETARRLRDSGILVTTLVRAGEPAETILSVIEEQGFDIVAMATHARQGIERLVLGSVAEAVLSHTYVPVLLQCIHKHAVPVEYIDRLVGMRSSIAEKQAVGR